MSDDSPENSIISFNHSIQEDSPVPEANGDAELGEMAITEIQFYLRKYSTTSSVFAEQSITNPDYQRTLYCISCILQAELFDDLKNASMGSLLHPELVIEPTLPPHLGGPVDRVPEEILERECQDDPELRREIIAGTVPTVDTILRFISWIHQTAKYSAQCNIVAFIYVKRMMDVQTVLTVRNWRGMWLGAVMLAQKVFDDCSLRTSSFASILPGITKAQLKALELKIFSLLNFGTGVKPSLYARFYFELREIFKNITGEFRDASLLPRRRPLSMKGGKVLSQCVDDPAAVAASARSSARSSKANTPRGKQLPQKQGYSSCAGPAAGAVDPTQQRHYHSQQQQQQCHDQQQYRNVKCGNQPPEAAYLRLPQIHPPQQQYLGRPVTGQPERAVAAGRYVDDGAGTQQQQLAACHQHYHQQHCAHQQPPQQQCATGSGNRVPTSAATTPGGAARSSGRSGRRTARTLEDFDYVNPSIFVLS